MENVTKQSLFDKVVTHLLTQMKKAQAPIVGGAGNLTCKYRNAEGLRCAIGCLIPDEEYHPDMENFLAFNIGSKFPALDFMVPHGEFLGGLQNIHDGYEPEEWKMELAFFANLHGLNFNPPI